MSVVPHSDCFCDACMVKYWKMGWIESGTPAWNDVMKILKEKGGKIDHES